MTNAADKKGFCDCNQGRLPCTCKQLPPEPPPMRTIMDRPDADLEVSAITLVLIIILALMIGIFSGWQMRGGCL